MSIEILNNLAGSVASVNGKMGVIALDSTDIPFAPSGTLVAYDVSAALVGLDETVAAVAGAKEDSLGNPASSGYILESTVEGVRSWTARSAACMVATAAATTTQAVSNTRYICNTSAGTFTLTLPATPAAGECVEVLDAAGTFGTNKLTIASGSNLLAGDSGPLDLTDTNLLLGFIWSGDPLIGWQLDLRGNVATRNRRITISTQDPTGGEHNDIHIKYIP